MYLGLDLGTSSLKALVLDYAQNIIAEAVAPLEVSRPHDGWSEQDPARWIAACESVFEQLGGQIALDVVKGIGLSGHMHGACLLDVDDRVLWPCILWNDTRSATQAATMDADPAWREISGNIVFPGFTAPKVQWMREAHPEIFDRIETVLLPKDYVRLWLTGEKVAEMSDAAGTSWLETGARAWSADLLGRSGLSEGQMPRLVEGSAVSGQLRGEVAARFGFGAHVVVAGGAGDNAAAAIGMGVVAPGQAFVSLGTSGVLFAASEAYAPDPATAVHTFCHALPDLWHQMGVILSATDALNWWADLVGSTPGTLTQDLGPLHAPGSATFLPFLGGERTPHNDANLRAGFIGLDHGTDRAQGTRAVLEGVAFALADCRDALAATGTEITSCLAVGGGSKSDYWLEAVATALNLPLDLPAKGDFGAAFGAARLGMMAVTGSLACLEQPPIARTVAPNTALLGAFEEKHARYRGISDWMRGDGQSSGSPSPVIQPDA